MHEERERSLHTKLQEVNSKASERKAVNQSLAARLKDLEHELGRMGEQMLAHKDQA